MYKKTAMHKITKGFIGLCMISCFAFVAEGINVSTKDFTAAIGAWKGTLTYLDYKTGKPYTMPANFLVSINAKNDQQVIFNYQYPDEPKANASDTLTIKENGTLFDEATVTLKKINADGSIQIETERNGIDGNDNKKAVIKHVYLIGSKQFINRKEVKFDGEQNWIKRNEYSFSR